MYFQSSPTAGSWWKDNSAAVATTYHNDVAVVLFTSFGMRLASTEKSMLRCCAVGCGVDDAEGEEEAEEEEEEAVDIVLFCIWP